MQAAQYSALPSRAAMIRYPCCRLATLTGLTTDLAGFAAFSAFGPSISHSSETAPIFASLGRSRIGMALAREPTYLGAVLIRTTAEAN